MKLSAQSHASIASSLREAVDKYIADGERTVVTDIHLQPKQDSGELVIFNDDDEELSRTIIEECQQTQQQLLQLQHLIHL